MITNLAYHIMPPAAQLCDHIFVCILGQAISGDRGCIRDSRRAPVLGNPWLLGACGPMPELLKMDTS